MLSTSSIVSLVEQRGDGPVSCSGSSNVSIVVVGPRNVTDQGCSHGGLCAKLGDIGAEGPGGMMVPRRRMLYVCFGADAGTAMTALGHMLYLIEPASPPTVTSVVPGEIDFPSWYTPSASGLPWGVFSLRGMSLKATESVYAVTANETCASSGWVAGASARSGSSGWTAVPSRLLMRTSNVGGPDVDAQTVGTASSGVSVLAALPVELTSGGFRGKLCIGPMSSSSGGYQEIAPGGATATFSTAVSTTTDPHIMEITPSYVAAPTNGMASAYVSVTIVGVNLGSDWRFKLVNTTTTCTSPPVGNTNEAVGMSVYFAGGVAAVPMSAVTVGFSGVEVQSIDAGAGLQLCWWNGQPSGGWVLAPTSWRLYPAPWSWGVSGSSSSMGMRGAVVSVGPRVIVIGLSDLLNAASAMGPGGNGEQWIGLGQITVEGLYIRDGDQLGVIGDPTQRCEGLVPWGPGTSPLYSGTAWSVSMKVRIVNGTLVPPAGPVRVCYMSSVGGGGFVGGIIVDIA